MAIFLLTGIDKVGCLHTINCAVNWPASSRGIGLISIYQEIDVEFSVAECMMLTRLACTRYLFVATAAAVVSIKYAKDQDDVDIFCSCCMRKKFCSCCIYSMYIYSACTCTQCYYKQAANKLPYLLDGLLKGKRQDLAEAM